MGPPVEPVIVPEGAPCGVMVYCVAVAPVLDGILLLVVTNTTAPSKGKVRVTLAPMELNVIGPLVT